jgi:hypothetical protein
MDVEVLSSALKRTRISYLAEARRLLQEEQQKAKWDRDKKQSALEVEATIFDAGEGQS